MNLQGYRRQIFFSMLMIALGVVFTTTLNKNSGTVGIVFIAIGGLFFIIGMYNKKKEDEEGNNDEQD